MPRLPSSSPRWAQHSYFLDQHLLGEEDTSHYPVQFHQCLGGDPPGQVVHLSALDVLQQPIHLLQLVAEQLQGTSLTALEHTVAVQHTAGEVGALTCTASWPRSLRVVLTTSTAALLTSGSLSTSSACVTHTRACRGGDDSQHHYHCTWHHASGEPQPHTS